MLSEEEVDSENEGQEDVLSTFAALVVRSYLCPLTQMRMMSMCP